MELKDYCRSVEVELYGWKAKMYEMIRKVDKLRGSGKDQMQSQVENLHQHIEEMENIIHQLQTECPLEFNSEKNRVESKSAEMKQKYEDAMAAVLQF